MILQIDKVKEEKENIPVVLKSDYIDNVVRTTHTDRGVKLSLADDTVLTLEKDMGGRIALYNYLSDYEGYKICQAYLLNDEGKTLRKLIGN